MNWTDPTPAEVRIREALEWERRAFPVAVVVDDGEAALICADYPVPIAAPRHDAPVQPRRPGVLGRLLEIFVPERWL